MKSFELFLALAIATPVTRADLLVLYPGSPGSGVVSRFDAATGATLQAFGHDNEGMMALCLGADDDVYVSADILGSGLIYRFSRTGEYVGKIAEVNGTDFQALTVGPDGNLYAVALVADANDSATRHACVVCIPAGQASMRLFVAEGAGGMTAPRALAFGADGNLYVADGAAGVLRFDGATGASMGVFVPIGSGGLRDASGFAFGRDARIYVASSRDNAVLRFDAGTGAYIDTFVTAGSGGLSGARGLAFGADGNLYASSNGNNQVLRYDGNNGAFLGAFASNPHYRSPTGLVFLPTAAATANDSALDGSVRIGATNPESPTWNVMGRWNQ